MPPMLRRPLALIGAALLVAGCGSGGSGSGSGSHAGGARLSSNAVRLPGGEELLRDVEKPLSSGYAADGSLYYTETSPIGEHVGEAYDLSRISATSGALLARRKFPNVFDQDLFAAGSLWVTTSNGGATTLWRVDPRTLAVRSSQRLPGSPSSQQIVGSIAVAGGNLWVGTGLLDRVSLRSGRLDAAVRPPVPGPVELASGDGGRTLVASLGYEHPTYIARLNPVSGRLEARTTIPYSVTLPTVAGVAGGGVWLQNSNGGVTRVERLDAVTLRPTRVAGLPAASRRTFVRVLDGVVWVTESLSSGSLNYCANPVTGAARERLPVLPGNSVMLAADASTLYYTDVPENAHVVRLERAPISRNCAA